MTAQVNLKVDVSQGKTVEEFLAIRQLESILIH